MNYMYKVYMIAFILTLFLFLYNNNEYFTDTFTLPGKYDIHFVYFYSSKVNESLKLKERIIKLKENMSNTKINCFDFKIFLVDVEHYPLIQRKYNITKVPTMFIMLMNDNKVIYEEFDQIPSYISITNSINNIYSKKIKNATNRVLKARKLILNNS